MQRPVFYAIAIIITAYLPIFTLQRVEGRLFKPMAWTVAFALLGALIFSMLIAPVLVESAVPRGRAGMAQPGDDVADANVTGRDVRWAIRTSRWSRSAARSRVWPATVFLAVSGIIGSEFLPHLDEGAIWVRGTLAPSTGPTEGIARHEPGATDPRSFPEVTAGVSARSAGRTTEPIRPAFSTPNTSSI